VQKVVQRPVERQEEIVEYVPVTRSVVHHHMADGTVRDMRMSQLPAGANVVSENRVNNGPPANKVSGSGDNIMKD